MIETWYDDETKNAGVKSHGKDRQAILDHRYQWTPGCHLCDAEKADSNRRYSSAVDSYDDCYHARHRRWTSDRIPPYLEELIQIELCRYEARRSWHYEDDS